MSKENLDQEKGYREALSLAISHYENFPVVSFLIPAELRKHVAIIYWFARTADDYSDEGYSTSEQRLDALNNFQYRLLEVVKGNPLNNYEAALYSTIKSRGLNPENFINLITAFKQDITKSRYSDFDEVLAYCRNSANPIGRLLLELFNIQNEEAITCSDKICTALQLTNFIQDTRIDYGKGRIYYPADERRMFNVDEKMFEMSEINFNLKKLIEFSVSRTESMLMDGNRILDYLSGRFKYEIAMTIQCGLEILNKIRGADFDVFASRPVLKKIDYLKILIKSFLSI